MTMTMTMTMMTMMTNKHSIDGNDSDESNEALCFLFFVVFCCFLFMDTYLWEETEGGKGEIKIKSYPEPSPPPFSHTGKDMDNG